MRDHAIANDLLPCRVSWLKNAAPNLLTQDVVRMALTEDRSFVDLQSVFVKPT
jgi:hypothetical protein